MERCARRTFAAQVLDPPSEHWDLTDAQMQTHFAYLCQRPLFQHGATCHHVPRHLATPCGKDVDSAGHSAWQCNRAGIMARRNVLARAWRGVCLKAGWDAHVEQEVLLPTPELQVKRADVLVTKTDASQLILDVRTVAAQNPPEPVFVAAVKAKQREYVSTETNRVGPSETRP